MLPVILFSVIFNLPKFFEYNLDKMEFFNVEKNQTEVHLKLNPTELRLNNNYVFYYINLSRLMVSGLFPLISLSFLNFAIYRYVTLYFDIPPQITNAVPKLVMTPLGFGSKNLLLVTTAVTKKGS